MLVFFAIWDSDRSEQLNEEELRRMLQCVKEGGGGGEPDIEYMMSKLDSDRDANISYKEFTRVRALPYRNVANDLLTVPGSRHFVGRDADSRHESDVPTMLWRDPLEGVTTGKRRNRMNVHVSVSVSQERSDSRLSGFRR
jgi:hypothetical protein